MDPVTALRMEMEMVPVPDGYATSGMYYCDQENDLQELFDEECHESARGAMKAEQRLKKFQRAVRNIEHAAATVIQRNARRYFQFTDDANGTDYTTNSMNGLGRSLSKRFLISVRCWMSGVITFSRSTDTRIRMMRKSVVTASRLLR